MSGIEEIEHIFIIHRKQDTERDLTKLLSLKCNDIQVIEPEIITDSKRLICMHTKLEKNRFAVISLVETNMKLFQKIVIEKLNNVMIIEDDVIIENGLDYDNTVSCHALQNVIWNDRNYGTVCNVYPSYQKTKILYDTLLEYRKVKKNKFRAWDSELYRCAVKYNLDFKFDNTVKHNESYNSTLGNNGKKSHIH